MAAKPRYQIRSPQGQVVVPSGAPASGLYDDVDDAVAACRALNTSGGQDPNYQYVIFPVIHATA